MNCYGDITEIAEITEKHQISYSFQWEIYFRGCKITKLQKPKYYHLKIYSGLIAFRKI